MIFQIGQRVKILYSLSWPELTGTHGTIATDVQECGDESDGYYMGYYVECDAWNGRDKAPDGSGFFCPSAEQLEAVKYDGNDGAGWGESIWIPTKEIK